MRWWVGSDRTDETADDGYAEGENEDAGEGENEDDGYDDALRSDRCKADTESKGAHCSQRTLSVGQKRMSSGMRVMMTIVSRKFASGPLGVVEGAVLFTYGIRSK